MVAATALGNAALFEGRLDDSRRWFEEVLDLARANGDRFREIYALDCVALTHAYAGRHASALVPAEEALDLARPSGPAMEGFALYHLGEVLAASGSDPERALECLDRSIVLCEANRMRFNVGVATVTAASLRTRHGDAVEALRMFRDAVDIWRLAGTRTQLWTTLRNLVELFCRIGSDEEAVILLSAAASSETAPPSFGTEAEGLEGLRATLAGRMDGFDAVWERGRTMSDDDTVRYALAEIDRALERTGASTRPPPTSR
jgi:tetratricopeptide (TPR) repeat protein